MESRMPRSARFRSSLFVAMAFFFLFWLAMAIASLTPVAELVSAAAQFGSPFTWILIKFFTSPDWVHDPMHPYLMSVAIIGPYPVAGLIIGYFWPVGSLKDWATVRAVLVRFSLACLILLPVGLAVALWAVAIDS